jgi:hypothetical protein
MHDHGLLFIVRESQLLEYGIYGSCMWVCRACSVGTPLGEVGLGNRNAHLHFGIIINRAQANGNDVSLRLSFGNWFRGWGWEGHAVRLLPVCSFFLHSVHLFRLRM